MGLLDYWITFIFYGKGFHISQNPELTEHPVIYNLNVQISNRSCSNGLVRLWPTIIYQLIPISINEFGKNNHDGVLQLGLFISLEFRKNTLNSRKLTGPQKYSKETEN